MPISTNQFGPMPHAVAEELAYLSDVLDQQIPPKKLDMDLIVASWNIRELGRTQPTWTTDQRLSPKRNRADVHLIAEIISRFDVVAVQELLENVSALRDIMACLGSDWGFQVTDAAFGHAGGGERHGFIYDLRRVRPSGLSGELVLTREDLASPLIDGQDEQPVRSPYVVSFTTAARPFVLTTVHVVFKGGIELRAREAGAAAAMLKRMVEPRGSAEDAFKSNVILLGDFNIEDAGDPAYTALVEHGLQPDEGTLELRRTVSDDPGVDRIAYDQLAWFRPGENGSLKFTRLSGGTFPWNDHILVRADGDTTYRISDHYPLWVEFSVREAA